MKLLIEIRPGEGGQDAKLLVTTQAAVYLRYAEKQGLTAEVEDRGYL
jgi:protein subunit release factor A